MKKFLKICDLKFKICNSALSADGFTLLEVVITMVIIATLIGIATVNYITVQKSGRDSTRRADLRRVQSALELYYSDNHAYPAAGDCSDPGTWVELTEIGDSLVPASGKSYMDEQPCDPSDDEDSAPCAGGDGAAYYYCQFNDLGCYCLSAGLEKQDGQRDGSCGGTDPGDYISSHGVKDAGGYYLTCP